MLGFIKNLDKYELDRGASLSTYMISWIRQAMSEALQNKDKTIRRAKDFNRALYKYKNLIKECEAQGKEVPIGEALAKALNISLRRAEQLQNDYKLNPTSIEAKVNDNDDTEVGDFLGSIDENYEYVFDAMVDKEILLFLKSFGIKRY